MGPVAPVAVVESPDASFPPIPPEASHYATFEEVKSQNVNDVVVKNNVMTSSCESTDGLKRISEKYDSISNVAASPYKSPLRSPASDTGSGHFSFHDMLASQKFREGVTEQDLLQVDTFYRSHKTDVYVCGCLANVYIGSTKAAYSNDQWVFSCTGIPALVLDTGEHKRERKLDIVIAEKGTGFTLWRETINNQTGYKAPNGNFHTMRTASDSSKLAGLSFDDTAAAAEFYGHLDKLTADPNDELFKDGKGKGKKKKSVKDKRKKIKLPKKSEISQPCCFVHVTKLDPPSEIVGSDREGASSELISQPYNFQHLTVSSSGSLSNMMGSKLTLTSTESVDSGLSSEDRNSARNEK